MFDVSQYVKKITEAKPAGSGNPIRDGKFLLIAKRFEIKPSDKGSEVWFIGEFRVMRSEPIEVPPNLITPEKPLEPPNQVGQDCSFLTDLNSQMGGANVKEVIAADLGKKHDLITADEVSAWLAANVDRPGFQTNQPKAGRVFEVKTSRTITKSGKNQGKPGTRTHWHHVPQTPEELAAIRDSVIARPAF